MPAFSLAEPHATIAKKSNTRSKLHGELGRQLSELARSKPHRDLPATSEGLVSVLITSAQWEKEGLRETISKFLQAADVIALDAEILEMGLATELNLGMSGQDAIVLASVVSHLERHKPVESCFLNRNSKDFDDPVIREMLDTRSCKFFSKFEEGLRFIHSRIEAR